MGTLAEQLQKMKNKDTGSIVRQVTLGMIALVLSAVPGQLFGDKLNFDVRNNFEDRHQSRTRQW